MKTQEKTKWAIDPAHSKVGFKVKHLMISNVQGILRNLTDRQRQQGNDFSTASISVSINTASIDTEAADRDTSFEER